MSQKIRRNRKPLPRVPLLPIPPPDESRLIEAERGADTTIRIVIDSGRPDGLSLLELTVAATLARLLAASDFVPGLPGEPRPIVSLDEQLETFTRNTRVFYSRALERLGY